MRQVRVFLVFNISVTFYEIVAMVEMEFVKRLNGFGVIKRMDYGKLLTKVTYCSTLLELQLNIV